MLLLDTNLVIRQSFPGTPIPRRWTVINVVRNKDTEGSRILAMLTLCAFLLFLSAVDGQTQTREKSVNVNRAFKISLKSNPTTGYKWEVSFDKTFLKLKANRFKRSTSALIGAGGTQSFVFLPIKQGATEVHFVYRRPWEKSIAREETYKLNITR